MVDIGEAVTLAPVVDESPVAGDHTYVLAFEAVNVDEAPGQTEAGVAVAVITNCGGCVIIADCKVVQLLASVTVTLYVLAVKLVAVGFVCPPVQIFVYGPVPPEGDTVAVPSEPPKQVTAVEEVVAVNAVGSVTIPEVVLVQLFPSVTTTVQVPAVRLEIVAVPCPVGFPGDHT